jgi:hypothetical protein
VRNQIAAISSCLLMLVSSANYAASCETFIKDIRKQLNQVDHSQQLNWLSLDAIVRVLGQGKAATSSNGDTQYDWSCSADTANSLSITIGKEGKIATLTGKYSDDNGSEVFSNRIVQEKKQELSEKEAVIARSNDLTSFYKEYFKTNTTSFDQVKVDALSRVRRFYAFVRSCTPGTYQYMVVDLPGTVFYTSTIKGKQNDICLVESTFVVPNRGTGTKSCRYNSVSQSLFSEQQADFDGSGNFAFDGSTITPFQQVAINDCIADVKPFNR